MKGSTCAIVFFLLILCTFAHCSWWISPARRRSRNGNGNGNQVTTTNADCLLQCMEINGCAFVKKQDAQTQHCERKCIRLCENQNGEQINVF